MSDCMNKAMEARKKLCMRDIKGAKIMILFLVGFPQRGCKNL